MATVDKNFFPPEIMAHEPRMGVQGLHNYVNTVYSVLMAMQPGDSFIIKDKVKTVNRDLFKKTVELYMYETKQEFKLSENDELTKK